MNNNLRPSMKGFNEVFTLLEAVTNPKQAKEYLNKINDAIARNEELCGAINTKKKAEELMTEAELERANADEYYNQKVNEAQSWCDTKAGEIRRKEEEAQRNLDSAREKNSEATRLYNEAKEEHDRREAEIQNKERETDLLHQRAKDELERLQSERADYQARLRKINEITQ